MHYTYNESKKEWKPRKREPGDYPAVIGRIHAVPRTSDDKYFLRMLLYHQKGSTSFEDLRTVNGQLYPTNKAAAGALGLLRGAVERALGVILGVFCLLFEEKSNPFIFQKNLVGWLARKSAGLFSN